MKNWITLFVLILVAGLSRLVPHPWNFTAMTAVSLFAGSRVNHKVLAFVAPFAALLWSDLILGFHATMVYVYGAVALTTIVGLMSRGSWVKLGAGGVISSLLFFLITNFGVWMTQGLYPKTTSGLFECYVMALPFLHTQVAGDLFYGAILFGGYEVLRSWIPEWDLERA